MTKDTDLVGVWAGYVDGDTADTFYVEFDSDGKAQFGGEAFSYEAQAIEFNWYTDGDYLEVEAMANMYRSKYVYNYDSLNETLTLYVIVTGMLNDTVDDSIINAGAEVTLVKSDSSFYTLTSESLYSSYY